MNDFNRGALPIPCLRLDYGFGEQWASVELGDGTGYVRLADYENAKAENAKLRELENIRMSQVRFCEDLDKENSKLRELLKNALTYIEHEGCGVERPETGSNATLTPCDTCNRYETENCAYVIAQSARELGIEVCR